jgi:hypothetical protein
MNVSTTEPDSIPQVGETAQGEQQQNQVEYSLSGGIVQLLARLNIGLAFSSYQSNLLYMLVNLVLLQKISGPLF